jgi:chromosome segregation ATPase
MANVEYVKSLERKVQDLRETISTQEEDYKVLAKKNEESSLEIEQLRREVAELQVGKA